MKKIICVKSPLCRIEYAVQITTLDDESAQPIDYLLCKWNQHSSMGRVWQLPQALVDRFTLACAKAKTCPPPPNL